MELSKKDLENLDIILENFLGLSANSRLIKRAVEIQKKLKGGKTQ